ncbi:MAG: tRNA (cytidine(34)-2'-O)-methyltransferase [Bifidobacteriaceae bacterium]|jgi:tRNA (cytidine/uridine-2'-O-)-methyltransferase|nr:tRNA (cytidine(34)-2'-O)-methyltransferase [Bifidobacteriaceae bacterium]
MISKELNSDIPQLVFAEPRIAGNTGAAIRLCANTGSVLHLIEPLCFDLDDAKLRRSGLDYHDLTHLQVHKNFSEFLEFTYSDNRRIFAFRTQAKVKYSDIQYKASDYLLFGSEPDGLPEKIWQDDSISQSLYIPMRSYSRSINLANSAAIALYEAYRQLGFPG